MIQIQQLKLRPGQDDRDLRKKIAAKLHIRQKEQLDGMQVTILRRSVDARKKPDIFYVYTVAVRVSGEEKILRSLKKDHDISAISLPAYTFPPEDGDRRASAALTMRPMIVGAGPAGLFCALMLSRAGFSPLLIERGDPVEERAGRVEAFWDGGPLDPDSNVQFGEGGAGTFSDGKLHTMIRDEKGRIRKVLETFVECGADPGILYDFRPHIGTDRLREVLIRLREAILAAGGEIRFRSRLTDIVVLSQESASVPRTYELSIVRTDDAGAPEEKLRTQALILCPGHSARDTFAMLRERGFHMSAKAFAVGVRVQHPQSWIDAAMYGEDCPYEMEPASYKLAASVPSSSGENEETRGVYSFCMCPGGYVVNASSEEGHLAVNGMSDRARDSENANSAIVVTVSPEDYQAQDPLDGIRFQRELERKAFLAGDGRIPVQRFEDFVKGEKSSGPGQIRPVVKGACTFTDLTQIFPARINACLTEGIRAFGRRIDGFDHADVLLCAAESRTSSPVRLTRDPVTLESVSHPGVYPCGEGAGYAGGITSAAVDGIKAAEALASYFYIDFPSD